MVEGLRNIHQNDTTASVEEDLLWTGVKGVELQRKKTYFGLGLRDWNFGGRRLVLIWGEGLIGLSKCFDLFPACRIRKAFRFRDEGLSLRGRNQRVEALNS